MPFSAKIIWLSNVLILDSSDVPFVKMLVSRLALPAPFAYARGITTCRAALTMGWTLEALMDYRRRCPLKDKPPMTILLNVGPPYLSAS